MIFNTGLTDWVLLKSTSNLNEGTNVIDVNLGGGNYNFSHLPYDIET